MRAVRVHARCVCILVYIVGWRWVWCVWCVRILVYIMGGRCVRCVCIMRCAGRSVSKPSICVNLLITVVVLC